MKIQLMWNQKRDHITLRFHQIESLLRKKGTFYHVFLCVLSKQDLCLGARVRQRIFLTTFTSRIELDHISIPLKSVLYKLLFEQLHVV